MPQSTPDSYVKVAVMGATGTGKSTFIHLLTNDDKIHIGHDPDSETSDIQTAFYTDTATGRSVMLIDTPGFDDSREGVTDTDVLKKIIEFLEPENDQGKKLNGIIYMHRISDRRVGGLARKNIRMFQALCGEKTLRNVLVATTNWDSVIKQEGDSREAHLKQGVFKPLLDAGAQMRRHANSIESARAIMSELIPLPEVTTQIQVQVMEGTPLGATDAGRIINQEIEEMKQKHTEELANVKKEMEEAWQARNKALRDELEQECGTLQAKIARADDDRAILMKTLDEIRAERVANRQDRQELQEKYEKGSADLRRFLEETAQARGKLERERSALQAKTAHAQADGQRELLTKTIEGLRAERAAYKQEKEKLQKKHESELANLRGLLEEAVQARGELERKCSSLLGELRAERVANEQKGGGLQKQHERELADLRKGLEAAAQLRENALREELRKGHAEELVQLRDKVEEAAQERYEGLRAVLNAECEVLVEKLFRAEEDQVRLMKTLDKDRKQQRRNEGRW